VIVSRRFLLLGGFVLFLAGLWSGHVLAGSRRAGDLRQPATTGEHGGTSAQVMSEEVPGVDIFDLPRYPDSTRVEYSRSRYDNLTVTEAQYVVEGDAQKHCKYYSKIFDTQGWGW